jgi:hypothetical protein
VKGNGEIEEDRDNKKEEKRIQITRRQHPDADVTAKGVQ